MVCKWQNIAAPIGKILTHAHTRKWRERSCVSCHISSHAGGRVIRKSPNKWRELTPWCSPCHSLSYPMPSSCHESCDECVQHPTAHKPWQIIAFDATKFHKTETQSSLTYVCVPGRIVCTAFHSSSPSHLAPQLRRKMHLNCCVR